MSEQFTFCKVKISICYNLPFGFMNKHDSNLVPHAFAKDKNSSITKEQVFTIICVDFSGYKIQCRRDLSLNDPLVKDPLLPMNNRTAKVETFFKHLSITTDGLPD